MIEGTEREMLFALARSLPFSAGENAVEFGCFFGRSTNCIAQGLAANPSFTGGSRFYAYDSFRCRKNGGFAPYVLSFSQQGDVLGLLRKEGDMLDFLPVFEHYLGSYIASGLVVPTRAELADSQPFAGDIALMHIDSPKYYDELKVLTFRFFPRLRQGSIVIFQDFFFHWSATLIAAVMAMADRNLIRFRASAASSLLTEVLRRPSLEDAAELELQLTNRKCVPTLIDKAIALCSAMELNQRELYLPRLTLAKLQYLWESGDHAAATAEIANYFNSGKKLNQVIVNDFMEMLSHGFSARKLYEQDHEAK